ncbi:GNAT family N-acetyltransferase [Tundrisphaera sp. TA3]|uniref:GNAT family N-acetyltransferase n=1 Tax=Tundrisphaera sp. TA3 TaxID=3435775 RepID=UPI003EB92DAC
MSGIDPKLRVVDAEGAGHLDEARRLFRAFASEYDRLVGKVFAVQGFEAEVAGLPGRYAPPSGSLLLAMDGDVAAGCVALRDLGDGTCEMKRLYADPVHRGRGVGRLLVRAILDRAGAMGYRRMVLDTLPEMAGALALYWEYGFVEAEPYWDHPAGHAIFLGREIVGGGAMGDAMLAELVQSDLAAYFEHLGARVERLARMLTADELWHKPFGFGNSVGRIVAHLTGSLRHFIGAEIAGTGYVRDRPAEFAEGDRPDADALLAPFRATIAMVVETLRSQGEAGLTTPITHCGEPIRDRFGLFLVCAGHINNHVGQITYLVQAHGHALDEKSW